MENNIDTQIVQAKSSMKQELIKLAVTAFAATLANKLSGKLVDRMFEKRTKVVAVETITE